MYLILKGLFKLSTNVVSGRHKKALGKLHVKERN